MTNKWRQGTTENLNEGKSTVDVAETDQIQSPGSEENLTP